MRLIVDSQTYPCWNLAAEEYLLHTQNEDIIRLWRNAPSVITGRNQHTLSEVIPEFIQEHNIQVVRRLSGGGAVFHDLGNVNFSFFSQRPPKDNTSDLFVRFTAPIVEALNRLQVPVCLRGRNDLVIGNKKCSGNAIAVHGNRVLMHGTLLYSAQLGALSGALKAKLPLEEESAKAEGAKEKKIARGVASNPSKVCNIIDYLPDPMDVIQFIDYLAQALGNKARPSKFTDLEKEAIDHLTREKYSTYAWNYGLETGGDYIQKKRFTAGTLEIHLFVNQNLITKAHIYGDYFSLEPTAVIEDLLQGCHCNNEAVLTKFSQTLSPEAFNRYFQNIGIEQFVSLFPKAN